MPNFVCENCGHQQNAPLYSKLCSTERKVARVRAKGQIPKLMKDLERDKDRALYLQVRDFIDKIIDWEEFHTQRILGAFDIKDKTWGDKILVILDSIVCDGIIHKKRFNKGKGGHIFVKLPVAKRRPCPFFKIVEGKKTLFKQCNFDFVSGILVSKQLESAYSEGQEPQEGEKNA